MGFYTGTPAYKNKQLIAYTADTNNE